MDENKRVSEQKLLYDPLFFKKPDVEVHDEPGKGIFGKTGFKKAVFIIVLISFISLSMFMSFYSVSADMYKFDKNGSGYVLSSFKGQENNHFLFIDYVTSEDGNTDTDKPVNEVRSFAVNCNEYVEYIYISKSVDKINPNAFYSCAALRAFIVDPDNPNYASVEGVLYEKHDGILTKIIQYPNRNGYYRTALAMNIDEPVTQDDVIKFKSICDDKTAEIENNFEKVGRKYQIVKTVTSIGQLCFADCKDIEIVSIPTGVVSIETMAFFKCEALKEIDLPDGLAVIGSDAFSSCKSAEYLFVPESVTEIGHHAFHKCESVQKVYMGHESENDVELGDEWTPQVRKIFMTDVEVRYGSERGVK